MSTSRISRAAVNARSQILAELKDDHKRVKKAYRQFQKLDGQKNPESCAAIVGQVLDELTVHSALEEELLYPTVRGAIADASLIDEAEVEHEAMHTLMDQLRGMSPEDEKYAARFTVMCEYVLHHVKEEENEMFPLLEKAKLDWEAMASDMSQRRQELMPGEDEGEDVARASPATASAAADDEGDLAGEDAAAETPAGVADEDGPAMDGNRSARRVSPGRSGPARR